MASYRKAGVPHRLESRNRKDEEILRTLATAKHYFQTLFLTRETVHMFSHPKETLNKPMSLR